MKTLGHLSANRVGEYFGPKPELRLGTLIASAVQSIRATELIRVATLVREGINIDQGSGPNPKRIFKRLG